MLDEYSGVIDIVELLKDKFGYVYNYNLLDLYNQPFIEMESTGVSALFWIIDGNDRYLFKPLDEPKINIWGELLSSKLASKLGIKCAKYRYAKFGSMEGVITKSFIKDDEELILGSKIMQDYFNKEKDSSLKNKPAKDSKVFSQLNNLEDISVILNTTIANKKQRKDILLFLFKMLIFDIISLQIDRHPNNWGVIKAGNNYKPCCLFDNSTSFGVGRIDAKRDIGDFLYGYYNQKYDGGKGFTNVIYKHGLSFTLTDDEKVEKQNHIDVLEKILSTSSSDDITNILQMIDRIDDDFIESLLDEVQKENGISMEEQVYFYIFNTMCIHIHNLKDIIKEYRDDLYARQKKFN